MSVQFSEEIEKFEKVLSKRREELKALLAKKEQHSVQTQKARAALTDLQAVLRGETPPSKRSSSRAVRGISSVPVDSETNRPARGARRQQVIDICKQVGAAGKVFRTADVLAVLRKVEDDFTTGMRSYTYTVMNALEAEGHVERKGRGKWVWKG